MIFTRFFVEKMMWIRRLVRVCAICPSGLRFPIIPFHPFRVGLGIFPSRGLHPRLFHPTPSGWTSLRDSRPGGCTPGYSIPPLRGGPHFAIPVPGVAPPAIPSHPFGVDLTSRFPSRGLHPRLFHPTPSGWTSLRDSRTGGCTPGYSIPPLRGGPHFAIPVPGVAPPAIPSHPFGVDLTSRFPYRGLHPRLFHPTPSGWTSLRDSRTGGCTPGYSIPPLRGGPHFAIPVPGVAPPAIPSHPFGVDLTSRFPYRGLHPRLFHPTPSGWTSLRDSRPGGCTPGYSIPPLRGGPHFAIPVPGVAPPAIPSHPFGVDLTSRFPYRGFSPPGYSIPPLRGGPHFAFPAPGVSPTAIPPHPFAVDLTSRFPSRGLHPRLFHPHHFGVDLTSRFPSRGLHPRLFHPTPSGWTSLRDSRPGGCAPPAIPSHPFGVDLTSRFPSRGLHPRLFHPTPSGWTSLRDSRPGGCTPGYSIPPL